MEGRDVVAESHEQAESAEVEEVCFFSLSSFQPPCFAHVRLNRRFFRRAACCAA